MEKSTLLRAALTTMYYSGIDRMLAPLCRGVGIIFTLHNVRPAPANDMGFAPNRILEITPEYLETVVRFLRDYEYDIISLDEAHRRLVEKDFSRRFAVFTLDDGYNDVYEFAAPIFDRYDVPYTVYLATGLPDETVVLWWLILESIIRNHSTIEINLGNGVVQLPTEKPQEKNTAFDQAYWRLRGLPHTQQQSELQELIARYDFDTAGLCRSVALSWDQVRRLNDGGLASFEAHTVNHHTMTKLSPQDICDEAESSRERIAMMIGSRSRHFCYPYGDRTSAGPREFGLIAELGFESATTTRKGVLFPEHARHLHALPRVSLNGDYQTRRCLSTLITGTPFALMRGFRRLDVSN